jgi:hypothetical protein
LAQNIFTPSPANQILSPSLANDLFSPSYDTPSPSLINTSFDVDETMTLLDTIEADASLTPLALPSVDQAEQPALKRYGSLAVKKSAILQLMRDIRLSPADLLLDVLTTDSHYAAKFFSGAPMHRLLDAMVADARGERIFREWVTPRAIDITCDIVSTQMDSMVKELSTAPSLTKLTPQFLRAWSLKDNVVRPADKVAPDVVKILFSAVNTRRGLENNTKKSSNTVSYPNILIQLF